MAIEHLENWSIYGLDGQARLTDGVYSQLAGSVGIVADPDPSAFGNVLHLGGYGTNFLTYVLNTPATTIGWAERLYFPGLTGIQGRFMKFMDASLGDLLFLYITATGQIGVKNGAGTILGLTSLATKITANGWHHVEVKTTLDIANGAVEIRIDGLVGLILSNVNTIGNGSNRQCAIIRFKNDDDNTYPIDLYIKDVMVYNSTGTHNTDFVGSVQIITLKPDSDAALQWAPNTGTTGFNRINFAPPTDDASYIAAATAGLISQFTLSDLPPNVTQVKGCQLMTRAKKADGGDGNIQTSLVHNTSALNGVDRPITTAYTYWKDVFETDPQGGGNLTPAAMNEMQVKLVRTV